MKIPRLGRRTFLKAAPASVAAWQLAGCANQGAPKAAFGDAREGWVKDAALAGEACEGTPRAYIFGDAPDDLRESLMATGFEVAPLPLDASPIDLRGMIVLPAFASETPGYAAYMEAYAPDLYAFVDNANLLVQLAQATAAEPSPPFLPTTHTALRTDVAFDSVHVVDAGHALLAGLPATEGVLDLQRAGLVVDAFDSQDGFEIILADASGRYPVLMEGAYGQGRFVLSALSFDYGSDRAGRLALHAFCANLVAHVHSVCARSAQAIKVATSRTTESFAPGSQLLVALPDTQVYSLRLPGLLAAQTTWIREYAEKLDIRCALQLGDMTNNNTHAEWQRAALAFELLRDTVPYAIATGNHDYGPSGDASSRDTLFNDYFDFDMHAGAAGFGGAFEFGKLDNTFQLISVGGRELVILALEWAPRDEVVEWADQVMTEHANREGVLITHAYLNFDSLRYDHTDRSRKQRFNPHDYRTPGSMNDGEQLWQKLVRRHRFIMTLNGHVLGSGCGYLTSPTDAGTTCHQMLSNYQMRSQGGEGYMRVLEFLDDGRSVEVRTYSALYDKFLDEEGHNFSFTLD